MQNYSLNRCIMGLWATGLLGVTADSVWTAYDYLTRLRGRGGVLVMLLTSPKNSIKRTGF